MKVFNLEFGVTRDAEGKVFWCWYELDRCYSGCLISSFGPFYFTILRGDCK